MENLLPGLFQDLSDHGSEVIDFGRQFRWFHGSGWKANCEAPYRLFMQTRALLEWRIRHTLLARDNVEFLGGTEVVRPLIDDGRLHGVQARSLSGSSVSDIACDVMVDATGRGSRARHWLKETGYEAPSDQQVQIGLGYASRLYQVSSGDALEWKALAIHGPRPAQRHHGLMFMVEGGRLLFTLMGYEGEHPPTDPEGWEAFARGLDRPDLYEVIQSARPLGDIAQFKVPAQRWRRYDQLDRLPAGLVVIGDAVCCFDPVFGQGMSVAALEAEALASMLEKGSLDVLAFARACKRIIGIPWFMSSAEAYRYPTASSARPSGLGALYLLFDRIFECANRDPEVYRALISVMHLHKGPSAFLNPAVLVRLARG